MQAVHDRRHEALYNNQAIYTFYRNHIFLTHQNICSRHVTKLMLESLSEVIQFVLFTKQPHLHFVGTGLLQDV